jgi:hypothetical protein
VTKVEPNLAILFWVTSRRITNFNLNWLWPLTGMNELCSNDFFSLAAISRTLGSAVIMSISIHGFTRVLTILSLSLEPLDEP